MQVKINAFLPLQGNDMVYLQATYIATLALNTLTAKYSYSLLSQPESTLHTCFSTYFTHLFRIFLLPFPDHCAMFFRIVFRPLPHVPTLFCPSLLTRFVHVSPFRRTV